MIKQSKTFLAGLALLISCYIVTSCMGPVTNPLYPPINIKIMDSKTGEPIYGAVLAVDWVYIRCVYECSSIPHKTIERVSNESGKINLSGAFKMGLDHPSLALYKKGYRTWLHDVYRNKTDFKWRNFEIKLEKIEPGFTHKVWKEELRKFRGGLSNMDRYRGRMDRSKTEYADKLIKKEEAYLDFVESFDDSKYLDGRSVTLQRLHSKRFVGRSYKGTLYRQPNKKVAMNEQEVGKLVSQLTGNKDDRNKALFSLGKIIVTNSTIQDKLSRALEYVVNNWENFVKLDDARSQHRFVKNLGAFGKVATPILAHAIENAQDQLSIIFLSALGYTSDIAAVNVVLSKLNSSNTYVKLSAIRSLGRLGSKVGRLESEKITKILIEEISHKYSPIGRAAVNTLNRIKHKPAKAFVLGLQHDNYKVHSYSSKQLVVDPSQDTVNEIVELLKNPNYQTRRLAVEVLGKIHNESVIPAIIKATKDKNEQVRNSAIVSLGLKISKEATDELARIYDQAEGDQKYQALRVLFAFRHIPNSFKEHLLSTTVPENEKTLAGSLRQLEVDVMGKVSESEIQHGSGDSNLRNSTAYSHLYGITGYKVRLEFEKTAIIGHSKLGGHTHATRKYTIENTPKCDGQGPNLHTGDGRPSTAREVACIP